MNLELDLYFVFRFYGNFFVCFYPIIIATNEKHILSQSWDEKLLFNNVKRFVQFNYTALGWGLFSVFVLRKKKFLLWKKSPTVESWFGGIKVCVKYIKLIYYSYFIFIIFFLLFGKIDIYIFYATLTSLINKLVCAIPKDAPHATLINSWIDINTCKWWINSTILLNFIASSYFRKVCLLVWSFLNL